MGFRKGNGSCTSSTKTWVEGQVADCDFRDVRLHRRFRMLLEQPGSDVGQSIRQNPRSGGEARQKQHSEPAHAGFVEMNDPAGKPRQHLGSHNSTWVTNPDRGRAGLASLEVGNLPIDLIAAL